MSRVNVEVVRTIPFKPSELLSSDGWKQMQYRTAVHELNIVIAPLAEKMADATTEWASVFRHDDFREGHGSSYVDFTVRRLDGNFQLRMDLRSDERNLAVDCQDLNHTTIQLTVAPGGKIKRVEFGRGHKDSDRVEGNRDYMDLHSAEWDAFRPFLNTLDLKEEQTRAIRDMANMLAVAIGIEAEGLPE